MEGNMGEGEETKGLRSLQRGTRRVKMLISERQKTISPELCYECLGRLNYRNKEQQQIWWFGGEQGLEQGLWLPGQGRKERKGPKH